MHSGASGGRLAGENTLEWLPMSCREPVQRREVLVVPRPQGLCDEERGLHPVLPPTNPVALHRLLLEAAVHSFAEMSHDDLLFPGHSPPVQL